ncbi:cupin domain-containing protein [Alkalinema pantanalense CENA528]|uniref:cupin domain-containing protein n=1 Tax=Alkalinema pantanalense TaxID=1620705 RepID=UPI003D6DDF63
MKYRSLSQISGEPVSHNPEITKQVMLRSTDVPHLTNFSQARFAPGQSAVAHSHADMYEVFFVEAGIGEIRINGESYALLPGTCVAVEAGELHEVLNTGNVDLVLTYFGISV